MTTRILIGDVRERLRDLPTASVDCVVTSPPYWGLRSYLDDGHPDKPREIGLERTLGEHLDVLVAVFREVRRVLKPQGTCWVNYDDCYAADANGRPWRRPGPVRWRRHGRHGGRAAGARRDPDRTE